MEKNALLVKASMIHLNNTTWKYFFCEGNFPNGILLVYWLLPAYTEFRTVECCTVCWCKCRHNILSIVHDWICLHTYDTTIFLLSCLLLFVVSCRGINVIMLFNAKCRTSNHRILWHGLLILLFLFLFSFLVLQHSC